MRDSFMEKAGLVYRWKIQAAYWSQVQDQVQVAGIVDAESVKIGQNFTESFES